MKIILALFLAAVLWLLVFFFGSELLTLGFNLIRNNSGPTALVPAMFILGIILIFVLNMLVSIFGGSAEVGQAPKTRTSAPSSTTTTSRPSGGAEGMSGDAAGGEGGDGD